MRILELKQKGPHVILKRKNFSNSHRKYILIQGEVNFSTNLALITPLTEESDWKCLQTINISQLGENRGDNLSGLRTFN